MLPFSLGTPAKAAFVVGVVAMAVNPPEILNVAVLLGGFVGVLIFTGTVEVLTRAVGAGYRRVRGGSDDVTT